MKLFVIVSLVFAATTAAAQDTLVKECKVEMKSMDTGKPVAMTLQIFEKADKSVYSNVSQTVDGATNSRQDTATISEGTVREGLSADSIAENLNTSEKLVAHAMMLASDPVMAEEFSAGIELKDVRSAKVYQIGEATNMGLSAIVEAKDAQGKVLGSYLGGFLVSACK